MISISIISGLDDERRVITSLLAEHDDFRIVNTGKDSYDAVKSAQTDRPDIIITDFNMGHIDGIELTPIIKRYSPSTKIIVLCSENKRGVLGGAFRAGISGYLLKQDGFDNLAFSVRCVYYGGLYISNQAKCYAVKSVNEIVCMKVKETVPLDCNERQVVFSMMETLILKGIALGYNDSEIAEYLNINPGTVRNNVNHIKHRTGLHNRTQITIYAMLYGIINAGKIWGQFAKKEVKQAKKMRSEGLGIRGEE